MYYTAIQSSTSDVLLPVCTGSRIKYSKHITYSMHILISVLYALHTVKWKKIYLLKIYRSDTHTICSTACTPFVEHRKLFLWETLNCSYIYKNIRKMIFLFVNLDQVLPLYLSILFQFLIFCLCVVLCFFLLFKFAADRREARENK